jgi:DNA-binding CsgD family transcriptional regulator
LAFAQAISLCHRHQPDAILIAAQAKLKNLIVKHTTTISTHKNTNTKKDGVGNNK